MWMHKAKLLLHFNLFYFIVQFKKYIRQEGFCAVVKQRDCNSHELVSEDKLWSCGAQSGGLAPADRCRELTARALTICTNALQANCQRQQSFHRQTQEQEEM